MYAAPRVSIDLPVLNVKNECPIRTQPLTQATQPWHSRSACPTACAVQLIHFTIDGVQMKREGAPPTGNAHTQQAGVMGEQEITCQNSNTSTWHLSGSREG